MDFTFNNSISREVLNNYLARAVSHASLLDNTDVGKPDDVSFEEDLQMLLHEGAKLIGRAAYVWSSLDDAEHWQICRKRAELCHKADPEMMLQCCVFECVRKEFCESIAIPEWVFKAFGKPYENRCFAMDKMLFADGRFTDHWGKDTCVPNIMSLEGQMWIYYRACMYISCGIEAIHFGQVWLIGALDKDWQIWHKIVKMIRDYAKAHARRGYVVCDAHCHGLITPDGHSIMDFNSFPIRLREIVDEPMKCVAEAGYSDSLFGKSKGGIHPSGWEADPLPFLVEFDNFGRSRTLGQPTPDSIFAWGYDEITWFAIQPEEYRAEFLRYINDWVNSRYPEGWVQMPSRRLVSGVRDIMAVYRANNPPLGLGDEKTIADIWRN